MTDLPPHLYPDFEIVGLDGEGIFYAMKDDDGCMCLVDHERCPYPVTHVARSLKAGYGAWLCDFHAAMTAKAHAGIKGMN